jgi:hypothetical protein
MIKAKKNLKIEDFNELLTACELLKKAIEDRNFMRIHECYFKLGSKLFISAHEMDADNNA